MSRRMLQVVVAVLGLVPVLAGAAGVALGSTMAAPPDSSTGGPLALDSHVRYLSGLLLAIGLAFWSTIPRIEHQSARFRLLTALVVVGGLSRLGGVVLRGPPPPPMLFGLGMELVATPLLCWWQYRVAAAAGSRFEVV